MHIQTAASKIKRNELDKKIVEVGPGDNFNTEIFPQFISKNMRYKCSILLCTYIGLSKKRCPHGLPPCITYKFIERNQIELHLMHHGENLYKCQHCDYIDFNRVYMETHMRNTHLLV
ncbi:Zinc finger Y-chromosomal protein 2 [Aphis craccivora]|uniref:Zinc finger Y-chromosomal protein 2 n=1 Tax=Aphis craccivora TaxID=307492 RepID=A0A6G0ZAS3_APHCR|nr:Zinc finger Y-chromosomal protein 2 [Aphis craccivora]